MDIPRPLGEARQKVGGEVSRTVGEQVRLCLSAELTSTAPGLLGVIKAPLGSGADGPLLSPPSVTSLRPYRIPPHTMQLRLGTQLKLPPLIPIPAYTNNWLPWKCPWDRVEGGEGNSRGEAFLQR